MRRASKKNPIILPQQRRSEQTFEAILEGATHILSRGDWTDFNTNRIAEVSGVSVASVYQYFYDKNAIIKKIATDLIVRDHQALRTFNASLARDTENIAELVKYAVSLYSYRPLLRRKLYRINLAVTDDDFIREVICDYEGILDDHLERDFSHIKGRRLAASMVVQSVIGSCNGMLARDPHFYRDRVFSDELACMVTRYLSDR